MDEEGRALATALSSARSRRDGEGYPEALRRRAGQWLSRERARGESWVALGAALGVSSTTASNWARSAAAGGFLPVRATPLEPVAAPAPPVAAAVASPSTTETVLVTPRGFRVLGLSADALVFILERLG